MAAAYSSCAYLKSNPVFSLSPLTFSHGYRTLSLLPNSHHLNNYFGISYSQPKWAIKPSNSPSRFRVFSLRGPKVTVINGNSWEKSVLNSEIPVLVEFYASWCGPCTMVHRVIDEISTEYAGRINCFILHADKEIQIADDYDVKAVPVVLLFKNGKKRESVVGTMPKEFYVAAIERVLSS